MANFTASVYCKECKYSKAYYHGIYSNYPTVSYMCYYNCKSTNPHDTCEHFEYKSKMDEVEE